MPHIIDIDDIKTIIIDGKTVVTKIRRTYVYDTLVKEKYFNEKDQIHRDANSYGGDGPAVIVYAAQIIIHEAWYRNGKRHRDNNLPALISYLADDGKTIILQKWYIDGSISNYSNPVALFGYDD